jgi:hypothetical protein
MFFRQEAAFESSDAQDQVQLKPCFAWAFERSEFNGGRRYVVRRCLYSLILKGNVLKLVLGNLHPIGYR